MKRKNDGCDAEVFKSHVCTGSDFANCWDLDCHWQCFYQCSFDRTFSILDNPITTGFGSILSASLLPILTNLGIIFLCRDRSWSGQKEKGGSGVYCITRLSGVFYMP